MGKRSRSRVRLAARQGRPPASAVRPVTGEPSGLARLAGLAARQREVQAAVDAQVDVLAAAGTLWPAITAALGVTRQARPAAPPPPPHGPRRPRRRQARLVTAFLPGRPGVRPGHGTFPPEGPTLVS